MCMDFDQSELGYLQSNSLVKPLGINKAGK